MTLHVDLTQHVPLQISSRVGPILVVATCQKAARRMLDLIQGSTGKGVIALCGYETALEALEDHPGYFGAIVEEDRLIQDPDFPEFQSRLAEEEPERHRCHSW